MEHFMQPTPSAKAAKASPSSSHLQINYLARQYSETLPLISSEDTLPSLLSLIADYDGVLHRHESMAGNLGARPLGPILIQRFERLFDGPPRVLKTHGKEGTTVGWLDVVEFARNKPEQFNLEKMRDGVRVCQFYTKQCRVEISEEDYLLINSGIPQKMIPPQPIGEDEEKELGTLEILERNLGGVVQLADQGMLFSARGLMRELHAEARTVSAKARQLNHRLKNRKAAIISRREAERSGATARGERLPSPKYQSNGDQPSSVSPTSGFVAVNSRSQQPNGSSSRCDASSYDHPRTTSNSAANASSSQGASAATRAELLSKFHTTNERAPSASDLERRGSNPSARIDQPQKTKLRASADQLDYPGFLLNAASASPVAIPNTPSSLLPYVKPSAADRYDDSGPYKADMMLRMEQLNKGDRVQPPCDRCRRLHMDCLKNLTACMGCTRKHAKCSWKDVEEQELRDHPFIPRVVLEAGDKGSGDEEGKGTEKGGDRTKKTWAREGQGVRDEELLGEDGSEDEVVEVGKGHENGMARRYEAKSHSPAAAGHESNVMAGDRNRTNSAPATTSKPSPALLPQHLARPESARSTTPAVASTVQAAPMMSRLHQKPEIPLYRPPEAQIRSFTAHEWDTHTRSPTVTSHNANTRATPSSDARSDIHDELKSAALEAEKNFDRNNHEDAYDREPEKGERIGVYPVASMPMADLLVASIERKSPKFQPTPPPEVVDDSSVLRAVENAEEKGKTPTPAPPSDTQNSVDQPMTDAAQPATDQALTS